MTHPQTWQQLQEIENLIRSLADLGNIFPYPERRTIILRGPSDRVALAAWLVAELDKPIRQSAEDATPHEYHLSTDSENVVRVYHLENTHSAAERQNVAARIGRTTGIGRIFVYDDLRALAFRGTTAQVAAAGRILQRMQVQ